MLHKAWNSKGEMPYCFPRSSIKFQGHTGQNITDFDPNWGFPDYRPVAAFKSLRFALFKNCSEHQMHHSFTFMNLLFLAATKQLYEWYFLSVCLSVCHTFLTMFPLSYHHEIFRSYYQWQKWCPCKRQRSEVKVTEVTTQLNRFQTVTPVWIHIWWWNHAYGLMILRRGALLFSRSSVKFQGHTALKIVEFDPDWAFPDCNSSLNPPMAMKWCTKLEVA